MFCKCLGESSIFCQLRIKKRGDRKFINFLAMGILHITNCMTIKIHVQIKLQFVAEVYKYTINITLPVTRISESDLLNKQYLTCSRQCSERLINFASVKSVPPTLVLLTLSELQIMKNLISSYRNMKYHQYFVQISYSAMSYNKVTSNSYC